MNCLLVKQSLKTQRTEWLLQSCVWEQRAEETPRVLPTDPNDYNFHVGSAILHALDRRWNSQTQKRSKLQWVRYFPDLIMPAPIITVIFITVVRIYRVCFHHTLISLWNSQAGSQSMAWRMWMGMSLYILMFRMPLVYDCLLYFF